MSETAIVQYATKEQAMQAKSGLDKSPVICGVSVAVDFASDERVSDFLVEQQQQHHRQQSNSSLQQSSQDKWLSSGNPPNAVENSGPNWDNMNLGQFPQTHTTTNSISSSSRSSETESTTTNTLWTDSTFLPGLSSPWSSQPQGELALFPTSGREAGKPEPAKMSSSSSLSTYLPNGLF